MTQYQVATETISGVKLPKIFLCPECNRKCHLLRDDTSIYVDGSSVKVHECSKAFKPVPESSSIAWW